MYSLGCYSSSVARLNSSSKGPLTNYHRTAHPASKPRRVTSLGNVNNLCDSDSSRAFVSTTQLPAGQTSGMLLVFSMRNGSAVQKTERSSRLATSCPSNAGKKFTRRPTGSERSHVVAEKLLITHTCSSKTRNGKQKISNNALPSSMSTVQQEQQNSNKKLKISSSLEIPYGLPTIEKNVKLSQSSSTVNEEENIKNRGNAIASSFLDNKEQNQPSFTSKIENMSPEALPDNFMVSSSSDRCSSAEEMECSSTTSFVDENQALINKSGEQLLTSTSSTASSEGQVVVEESLEYFSASSDLESSAFDIGMACRAGDRAVLCEENSSSIKQASSEPEIHDANKFLTSIDDQRARSKDSENTPSSCPSELFISEASASFLSEPQESLATVLQQQATLPKQLLANEKSVLVALRNNAKQELEFLDSHFGFNEAEANSRNFPILVPPTENAEVGPIVAPACSSGARISAEGSCKINCIDLAEPYVHLKSILKTTTKYPPTPKKALSIQGAIAWYVSYYWNYSKGAKTSTETGAVRAPISGDVHRAKVTDGCAVLDSKLNDGDFATDSGNGEMIPAPDVPRRVTFAEPMVTNVHRYIGAQNPKRISPNKTAKS